MKPNIARKQDETINNRRRWRLLIVAALSLITAASLVRRSKATGLVNKADLAGPWAMTLTGDTGCGISTSWVTFTLNAVGSASNATITSHTSGCGDPTTSGLSFTINTVNPNGSGTANLSCGTGCGWNLNIQVSPDRSMFSVVDVSPANPGNYLEGIAIHQ
jgi:hypothetical protein